MTEEHGFIQACRSDCTTARLGASAFGYLGVLICSLTLEPKVSPLEVKPLQRFMVEHVKAKASVPKPRVLFLITNFTSSSEGNELTEISIFLSLNLLVCLHVFYHKSQRNCHINWSMQHCPKVASCVGLLCDYFFRVGGKIPLLFIITNFFKWNNVGIQLEKHLVLFLMVHAKKLLYVGRLKSQENVIKEIIRKKE